MLARLGGRSGRAGMALAIIEESLQLAIAYAKERRQFGQPIAQFQAVQLRLARMYAAQEAVRALLDRGRAMATSGDSGLAWFCAAKYTPSTLPPPRPPEPRPAPGGHRHPPPHPSHPPP